MSDAAPDASPSSTSLFAMFSVCSQCLGAVPSEVVVRSRHAIPCMHVVCSNCVDLLFSERKSSSRDDARPVCKLPGCSAQLDLEESWPLAMCTTRAQRVSRALAAAFGDQGDAGSGGESPLAPSTTAAAASAAGLEAEAEKTWAHWRVCADHKEPITYAVSYKGARAKPECDLCSVRGHKDEKRVPISQYLSTLRSTGEAQTAEVIGSLGVATVTVDAYRSEVKAWAAREVERLRVWEADEVKKLQAAVGECVALVEQVAERTIQQGESAFAQYNGVRATLEEIETALSGLPPLDAGGADVLQQLAHERRAMTNALVRRIAVTVPTAEQIERSLPLPPFDEHLASCSSRMAAVVKRLPAASLRFAHMSPILASGLPQQLQKIVSGRCLVISCRALPMIAFLLISPTRLIPSYLSLLSPFTSNAISLSNNLSLRRRNKSAG